MKYLVVVVLLTFIHPIYASEVYEVGVFINHEQVKKEFPPYQLSWALLNLAATQQDIELQPISDIWIRSINRLKRNQLDFLMRVNKNSDRQQWAKFSLPISVEDTVSYLPLQSHLTNATKASFLKAKVGVIEGTAQQKTAEQLGFTQIYASTNEAQLYQMLASGRIDLQLRHDIGMLHYCSQYAPSEPYPCVYKHPYFTTQQLLYVMTASSNKRGLEGLKKINAGLLAIHESEAVKKLFYQLGFTTQYYQEWKDNLLNNHTN